MCTLSAAAYVAYLTQRDVIVDVNKFILVIQMSDFARDTELLWVRTTRSRYTEGHFPSRIFKKMEKTQVKNMNNNEIGLKTLG